MKIQGRKCTLTVLKDNEFIPLPYSEETVRLTSKGYTLPSCIGRRNRLKCIETGKLIQGCFVTRLEYLCAKALFLLLLYNEQTFELYADRGFEKIIYKRVLIKGFELRGDNGDAFKLRFDLTGKDSYTESWPVVVPSLERERQRTYFFDGHSVTSDLKTLPLVYRFELTGGYGETSSYKIKLYFPLSDEHYPVKSKIEKLSLVLDLKDGVSLDLYDLEPEGEMVDINCADTVLCNQSFRITGPLVFNVRNQNEMLTIVL
ncbi:hypothetical protein MSI_26280 [Treponema sp. JC4]|uniref:hypothetical protein n=1 Tax=Treponema sp. JC4 TaxID=1124982 RepID=UPI00025B0B23|nr:hypothetical protein [Treponema sp. JC4]EID83961.1 hypothetical protein MSI_26280 [Treponema sp. JC4]